MRTDNLEKKLDDQANVQSPEERMANLLQMEDEMPPEEAEEVEQENDVEDESEDKAEPEEGKSEESKEEAKADDDLIDVEFEGKEYKVPQELKDALLRQSDYTRKTQEVAEQRKQLEHAREYLGAQAQMQQQFTKQYAQLYALDAQIEQMRNTDWNNLIESDPLQAIKLDRQMREVQEYRNRLAGEVQQEQTKFHEQQQEWVSRQLAQANEQLVKELPGWGAELATKIKATGESYGFTADELATIRDPRHVKVLHDAMKFRELQSKKPDVDKKVAKAASPTLKPSGKQGQKQTDMREMKQTLKKSGHLRDAQRIVEQML